MKVERESKTAPIRGIANALPIVGVCAAAVAAVIWLAKAAS